VFGTIDLTMVLAILPEIGLLVLAGLVLLFDALWGEERKRGLGWLTAGGLALIAVISLAVARPTGAEPVWGGMLRFDGLAFVFKVLFLFGAAITALFAMDVETLGKRGEFYLLLLVSTLGMSLMAAAGNIIMLYLAVETTSIPLYVMAGFLTQDEASTEAGFKYLLFGAMTSAIMLYGFSLLFGFTGETDLYGIAAAFQNAGISLWLGMGVLLLILVGFGFKVSAVPFHFWAPDVYQGAPTPVAGFLSTASKAAGFAVLLRVLTALSPSTASGFPIWMPLVAALATVTMTLGNVMALAQRDIKRLLAYSSIAHAGYLLVGVAAASELGVASVVFYLILYLLTNLAAFGIVAIFERVVGSNDIAAYAGLSRRKPWLALAMLTAFLSLAGVPPFAGFVGKVWLFAAAVERGLIWLVVIGVLNSIVGIYYYLVVLKVVYLYRSPETEREPLPITRPYAIGLTVLSLGIILLGVVFGPWLTWAQSAAAALF